MKRIFVMKSPQGPAQAPARLGQATQAPAATFPGTEAELGGGLFVLFDGINIILRGPFGCHLMSPSDISAFQTFALRVCRKGKSPSPDEVDVYHDGVAYKALLLRKLTIDEIYAGLK
jgi:hypothetical protein